MQGVVALGVGLVIGAVLALFRLPVAAPPTIAGVLCVGGISLGFWIVGRI